MNEMQRIDVKAEAKRGLRYLDRAEGLVNGARVALERVLREQREIEAVGAAPGTVPHPRQGVGQ